MMATIKNFKTLTPPTSANEDGIYYVKNGNEVDIYVKSGNTITKNGSSVLTPGQYVKNGENQADVTIDAPSVNIKSNNSITLNTTEAGKKLVIDAEKVSYNGKEVATTDMIPDTSKFISTNATSDEIITISTNKEMTLYNGVDKGFTLLQRGSDYPNSQQITMTKDNGVEIISNKKGINFSTNEGKFTYNKKEVATTDQIPDTSNFIKNSGNPGYNIGIDTTKEIFLTSESIYYSHPDSSNTTIFMFPIDPAADETGLSMIVNGDFELSTNNFKLNDKEVATTDMIPDTSNYVMKENKEDINISSSKSINISANESIAIFGDGGNMVLSSSSGASIQGTTKLDENGNLSLDLNDVNGTVVWGDMVMISSANSILLGVRNTDPNGDPISSIELSAEGIQINTDDTTNADGVYVRDQGKLKFMDKASFKTWLGI